LLEARKIGFGGFKATFSHDYFDYINYNNHIYSQRGYTSSSEASGDKVLG
jgi:hypothetical protein